MKKIVYIADPQVLAIPIIECNEPLVDLKNQQQLRYGTPPENELTINDYTKVRKTVFEKLCQAQSDLPKSWYFRLYEGFRSITVQKILFEQIYSLVVAKYPDKQHQDLFRETTRLVSPVENPDGTLNIPAHNTGGAVDVEIITDNDQLIDMGMVAKDWASVEPDLCLTDYHALNITAKQNRKILYDVMVAHGFVNYPTEWWHFSYGDRYWAYHKNQSYAIYGPADRFLGRCGFKK